VALRAALTGVFPPDDGGVECVDPWMDGVEAVVSFTGHCFVATRLPAATVQAAGIDAFGGSFSPRVITTLAGPQGQIDCLDVLLMSTGTGRTTLPERRALMDHPRVRHARQWRDGVYVHADRRGLVTVSRGIGGVAELSFEVAPEDRGAGLGRDLLDDGRGLVPDGEPVLLTVAPGNARSLRAGLAAGFVPVGAVQLVRPGPARPARVAPPGWPVP
jgi:GNAT superfamily N-acetyltransferase